MLYPGFRISVPHEKVFTKLSLLTNFTTHINELYSMHVVCVTSCLSCHGYLCLLSSLHYMEKGFETNNMLSDKHAYVREVQIIN